MMKDLERIYRFYHEGNGALVSGVKLKNDMITFALRIVKMTSIHKVRNAC